MLGPTECRGDPKRVAPACPTGAALDRHCLIAYNTSRDILAPTSAVAAGDYEEMESCLTMTVDVCPDAWKCERHGVATVQGLGLFP